MAAVTRETAHMVTIDGVRLDADVWRPPGGGPWPVLLMRQPYGRAIASTVVYAHPAWYAAHGYLVVIQDVRGRGTSEGEFRLLRARARGRRRRRSPGRRRCLGRRAGSACTGFSYQGMTQLLAAAATPAGAVRAIAPAMAAWDVRADFATEGRRVPAAGRASAGAANWRWRRRAAPGDAAAHQAIYAASRAPPLNGETAVPAADRGGCWAATATTSSGSRSRTAPSTGRACRRTPRPARSTCPRCTSAAGTTRCSAARWRAIAPWRSRAGPQHLVVGPWGHIPWSRHVGARDFGPDAANARSTRCSCAGSITG